MDLTEYKIVDVYTGKIVQARSTGELREWLENAGPGLSNPATISGLCEALEDGEDHTWHAAANGLSMTKKKGRRRK